MTSAESLHTSGQFNMITVVISCHPHWSCPHPSRGDSIRNTVHRLLKLSQLRVLATHLALLRTPVSLGFQQVMFILDSSHLPWLLSCSLSPFHRCFSFPKCPIRYLAVSDPVSVVLYWLRTALFTLKMKPGASNLSSSLWMNEDAFDTEVKQPMRLNRTQLLQLLKPKIWKFVCDWRKCEDAGEDVVHLGTGASAGAVWGILLSGMKGCRLVMLECLQKVGCAPKFIRRGACAKVGQSYGVNAQMVPNHID